MGTLLIGRKQPHKESPRDPALDQADIHKAVIENRLRNTFDPAAAKAAVGNRNEEHIIIVYGTVIVFDFQSRLLLFAAELEGLNPENLK